MKSRARPSGSKLRVGGGLLGLLTLLVVLAVQVLAPAAPAARKAAGHPCPVATGSGDSTFTRNFNPYSGSRLDFALGGIYEPLTITTPAGGGKFYPWLASSFKWSKDGKTLTLVIRKAKWSDGRALTNKDVVWSLTAGLKNPLMDRIGLTAKDRQISSIRTASGNRVVIKLKSVDSTFIGATLNNAVIVPQHIFAAHVDDIDKWDNPNPVGTGPFAGGVTRLNGQNYVLAKNKTYWMKGAPKVNCLERIAATSNDAALVQLVSGQADWSHNFIPNVETAYEAKDRKNYHAFYSTVSLPIDLFFDNTKYPYSLVGFRKGISKAIDRQKVSKLGEYGYAPPADAVGIKFMWPTWVDPKLAAKSRELTTYSPAAARKTFTDAGFTYKGKDLIDPRGNPVSFQIHVIAGWFDWVASLNIITQNLRDVGVDATVKLQPDWDSWFPNAASTKVVTLLWNYGGGPTPYGYFRSHFDVSQMKPSGEISHATGNWHHSSDARGTALLKQFRGTLNATKHKAIVNELQAIWLDKFPAIPLFVGPQWSTYSTKYFVGWPTPQNNYTQPIFNTYPDNTVTLTRIRPA